MSQAASPMSVAIGTPTNPPVPAGVTRIHVDRVVIRGAAVRGLDAAEVRAAVVEQIGAALVTAPLPTGRTSRESAVVGMAALPAGAGPLGRVVANAVTGAIGGPRRG
jgi:hypothetical protein